jgi:hypothetical protein
MSRVMFDSVNPNAIPNRTALVAGYLDGAVSKWPSSAAARFGRVVWITTNGSRHDADVADVETGDLNAAGAVEWLRHATSPRPTIYTSRSWWPTVKGATDAAGLHCDWWIADWTYTPHTLPGAVAVQFTDPPHSGGSFDLSLVVDAYWPNKPPAPVPNPNAPVPNHTQWHWLRYVFIPQNYRTAALVDHAWSVVSANPVNAYAIVQHRAPAAIKNATT